MVCSDGETFLLSVVILHVSLLDTPPQINPSVGLEPGCVGAARGSQGPRFTSDHREPDKCVNVDVWIVVSCNLPTCFPRLMIRLTNVWN